MRTRHFLAVVLTGCLALASNAFAADPELLLVIKDHKFEPAELKVPANTRIKLTVHNQDKTPEEFESKELKREKVIPGGSRASMFIGPLKPGSYKFYGEFHEKTAQGVMVVE